jgi:hypothetical protein
MNDEDLRVDDRCVARCDHDSRCTLPDGHTPTDRHETEHGCICYDQRPGDTREGWRKRALVADTELRNALSGEADAVRRAESAELGCEIAYRREPTQAEGDAHEYQHDQSMGASECIRECHVPMGNHHGHRCLCGRWVWGGPTVCQRCVDAEAVKIAVEWKAEADRLRKLFDDAGQGEHNVLALIDHYQRIAMGADDRLRAVRNILEYNGCDCDCDHHPDERGPDCEVCLACRIGEAVGK